MRQAIFFLCLWSCSLLAGHAQEADEANYDESKIPPYTLPALLKTSDGREITTVQQWEQIRRPELLSVFTEQVYGKMPADKVDVSYKKLDDNHSAVNGSATRKQIEITFSHNGIERKALLLMYLPNHVKTKVPVFLHFNFQGNQTVSSDPDIIPSQYSDRPRGNQASRWPVEKIIDAGYGLATVHYFDFFPDSKDRYAESILALFGHPSEGDIPADGGQAIAAWSMGLQSGDGLPRNRLAGRCLQNHPDGTFPLGQNLPLGWRYRSAFCNRHLQRIRMWRSSPIQTAGG